MQYKKSIFYRKMALFTIFFIKSKLCTHIINIVPIFAANNSTIEFVTDETSIVIISNC